MPFIFQTFEKPGQRLPTVFQSLEHDGQALPTIFQALQDQGQAFRSVFEALKYDGQAFVDKFRPRISRGNGRAAVREPETAWATVLAVFQTLDQDALSESLEPGQFEGQPPSHSEHPHFRGEESSDAD